MGHNQICNLATFDVTENENMSYSLLGSNSIFPKGCLSHMVYLSLPGTRKKSASFLDPLLDPVPPR